MLNILETLESYEIDFANEGVGDKLKSAGSAIAGKGKAFADKVRDILAKIIHAIGSFFTKLKGSIPKLSKEDSINNKAALVYVEAVLKSAPTINKLAKKYADNNAAYNKKVANLAKKYENKEVTDKYGKKLDDIADKTDKKYDSIQKGITKFDEDRKLMEKLDALQEKAVNGGKNIYGQRMASILKGELGKAGSSLQTLLGAFKTQSEADANTVALVAKYSSHVARAIAIIDAGTKPAKVKGEKAESEPTPEPSTDASMLTW